ncbi:MAG: hypothetical protein ACRENW_08195 [Thermodesulfobacteriota bacterium]
MERFVKDPFKSGISFNGNRQIMYSSKDRFVRGLNITKGNL